MLILPHSFSLFIIAPKENKCDSDSSSSSKILHIPKYSYATLNMRVFKKFMEHMYHEKLQISKLHWNELNFILQKVFQIPFHVIVCNIYYLLICR